MRKKIPQKWFWEWALGVSIRVKVMGIVIGVVLILGMAAIFQMRILFYNSLSHGLREYGASIAGDAAARSADFILTNNLFALHEMVNEIPKDNPDVRYVFVTDKIGNVLAHSFPNNVPSDLVSANTVSPDRRTNIETFDSEEGLIYDIAAPVYEGTGTVRVGMSTREITKKLSTITRSILFASMLALLLGIASAYALTLVLIRPLLDLREAALSVAAGKFSGRAPVWSKDEVGQLSTSFNIMTQSLEEMQLELNRKEEIRLKLLNKLMNAYEEERERISSELHDETGQSLTSLMIGLKVLERSLPSSQSEEIKKQVESLRELAARTLEEAHRLSKDLRPSGLDDWGFTVALERFISSFSQKTGLNVDLQIMGLNSQRLPAHNEIALYRIVQEALTNIVRHARAHHVSVLLKRLPESILAIVEDDGCGFDVEKTMSSPVREEKLGLYGMKERAGLTGGKLTIESRPGSGTTIFAEIPLPGGESPCPLSECS